MLKKEVIKELKKHNLKWEDFIDFMLCQAAGIKNDEPDYYEWDVKRFINNNK